MLENNISAPLLSPSHPFLSHNNNSIREPESLTPIPVSM